MLPSEDLIKTAVASNCAKRNQIIKPQTDIRRGYITCFEEKKNINWKINAVLSYKTTHTPLI